MIQNLILLLLSIQLARTANLLNSNNLVNARIQCEYKDLDGDSLILNCTLTSGLTNLNSNVNIQGTNSNDLNSDLLQNSGQTAVSSSVNIKVGIDRQWRTPWESLSINHNIIASLIWRKSRLSELGEYAFKDLNYLQRIDLSHNKLQHLTSAPFNRFEFNLIELDLSHNLFQQIPVDLFQAKKVQSLEILRFNENPIVHLHRKPFELIRSSLKTLELNYCQIRSIDLNTFDDMKQLESVSIIGNHLRYLNEYTFRDLSLRSLYLHDNPLVCDCHMRWLINYLKNVDYQQQAYESQVALTQQMQQSNNQRNLLVIENGNSNFNSYVPTLSVATAAQQLLKCDQPNSLKSKPNFLDINPDSFMCEVQISLRDSKTEGQHELGDDALLTCDVYGDPEPNVYWSFGQKPIEKALNNEDDKYYVQETRTYPMSPYRPSQVLSSSTSNTNKTSQLKIKNLQPSDIGVYICTAEISGSNNRKQIKYNLKQLKSGLNPGLVVNSVQNFITSATSVLFNNNGKPLSNWTLLLLLAILISLILFILMLTSFICWRCRRSTKKKELLSKQLLRKGKEDEKLLMSNQTNSVVDGHLNSNQSKLLQSHQINTEYAGQNPQMSNNSSATLIGNNNSSIRMAYPNNGPHLNDIYANHSLLTTTSTTTGSYLANNPNNQAIAIDTSNQTPRYHLLNMPPQNAPIESYYDDLRYNNLNLNDENLVLPANQQMTIYSSPYKQQYSPLIRRDDPTVPLYATLKPKLQNRPHQYSNYSSNNYLPYTTIQRGGHTTNNNTPPLAGTRTAKLLQQHLPPPPPPPPLKPKRTFEYVIGTASRDLHSESGAFLLASDDYDQANELLVCPPPLQAQSSHELNYKVSKNCPNNKLLNDGGQGSTTSLDEEDLDLNDLKDFEDVTFDNLRKPGEQTTNPTRQLIKNTTNSETSNSSSNQAITNDDLNNINNNTNSEQSLLLKSSLSSSDNNNEDTSNTKNTNKSDLKKSNVTQTTLVNQYETNSNSTDLNCNSDELNSKIYEETEI